MVRMLDTPLHVRRFAGPEVTPWLEAVAGLRMTVFAAWPYLYDGDMDYERDYLARYASSPRSVFVLAITGDTVVGASTGVPLADEAEAFRAPFEANGIPPGDIFYFGESVLLPEWRGRGLGHAFFDHREAHAATVAGVRATAFCAVARQPGDPRRPADARDLAPFWRSRGYAPMPGLQVELAWEEHGHGEVEHRLDVWSRRLPAA